MNGVAVKHIHRAAIGTIQSLATFGVATCHEAQGRTGLLAPTIRPIFKGARIAGSAITVFAHPGDNWMLHVAVELCQPGDIVIVAMSAENRDGLFGDLLATSMRSKGVQGLIIDAGCRDIDTLEAMNFPVWSKAVSAKGCIKATVGSVNIPVVCAGALVNPGDIVVADDDGVVIIPRQNAENVAAACQQRVEKEERNRARFANGELGLDIYQMRPTLAQAGLRYVDHIDDLHKFN